MDFEANLKVLDVTAKFLEKKNDTIGTVPTVSLFVRPLLLKVECLLDLVYVVQLFPGEEFNRDGLGGHVV